MKKAIVIDLDETLETTSFNNTNMIITLRPNINSLIEKLEYAKSLGIDIILCTSANDIFINRFFKIKPDFKNVFNKIYSKDNYDEWYFIDDDKYPIEYNVRKESNYKNIKPITTFGYDSILFIDDNIYQYKYLEKVFEEYDNNETPLEKDITYFSGYGFRLPDIKTIFKFFESSKNNLRINSDFKEYINLLRNEKGITYMCLVIDYFISKDFFPELYNMDNLYKGLYKKHKTKLSLYKLILERISNKECDMNKYKKFTELLFKHDKQYPLENIDKHVKIKKK